MRQYDNWDSAPMGWHRFVIYFSLPAGILACGASIPGLSDALNTFRGTPFEWLAWLDLLVILAELVLLLAAEIGLVRKAWLGVCCFIAVPSLSLAYAIFIVSLLAIFGIKEGTEELVGQALGCAVLAIVLWRYYRKRRALFSPQVTERTYAKPIVEAMETADDCKAAAPRREKVDAATTAWWLLAAAVVVIFVLCVSQKIKTDELRNEIFDLTVENTRLESSKKSLSKKLNDSLINAQNLKKTVDYFEQVAVFVTEEGTKYHRYDCQYMDGKSFWTYNPSAARSRGYEPCNVCKPPK